MRGKFFNFTVHVGSCSYFSDCQDIQDGSSETFQPFFAFRIKYDDILINFAGFNQVSIIEIVALIQWRKVSIRAEAGDPAPEASS
jgi:hypothetical protein